MTDNEKFTADLIAQLEKCVKLFSDKNGGMFYETNISYKNRHKTWDNIAAYDIDIYFNNYIVRFSYYPHIAFSTAHSVLTCYVSFAKTISERLFYPLSQILGYLDITPRCALTIPLILSPDTMAECFDCIAEELISAEQEIEALSYSRDKKDSLFNETFEIASSLFKRKFLTTDDIMSEIDSLKDEQYEYLRTCSCDKSDLEQILLRVSSEADSLISADKQSFLIILFSILFGAGSRLRL